MTQSSPTVLQVAAILNFMAEHPGRSFDILDLARVLKSSDSTCHALVAPLVESGFLYHGGEQTYGLGPRLVEIGRSAAEYLSPQAGPPEMHGVANNDEMLSKNPTLALVKPERSGGAEQELPTQFEDALSLGRQILEN